MTLLRMEDVEAVHFRDRRGIQIDSTRTQDLAEADSEFGTLRLVSLCVHSLLPADSPRAEGEDPDHVRALAQTPQHLPPIIVHMPDMRVIDGMHRLLAARMRGERSIDAYVFEGSADEAFVLALRANIKHGLPLSLKDRAAATARVLASFPEWSDRAIAAEAGLSPKTVSSIRRRLAGNADEVRQARIGRDGRVRPLSSKEGRLRAATLMRDRPDASLRQIAAAAGISCSTAHDVRLRVQRGESPLPSGNTGKRGRQPARPEAAPIDVPALLAHLRRDPSLRLTIAGRNLLRQLGLRAVDASEAQNLAVSVPPHLLGKVADLARGYAVAWQRISEHLEAVRDENERGIGSGSALT